jgi:AmiR/NasT family two-component response regulator
MNALPSLNIVVADDEADTREYLRELLQRLGHQVVAVPDGRQLTELCRSAPPDLIISDIRMPGRDGIESAAEINRAHPVPVILVSAFHDADLFARARNSHVMAYLVKPIKQANLEAAIALAVPQFRHAQALAREAAEARQALEDRKVIERAKGAIARRVQVDEEDAFRRLRKRASDTNRKLIEVAREVLNAEDIFRAFEFEKG